MREFLEAAGIAFGMIFIAAVFVYAFGSNLARSHGSRELRLEWADFRTRWLVTFGFELKNVNWAKVRKEEYNRALPDFINLMQWVNQAVDQPLPDIRDTAIARTLAERLDQSGADEVTVVSEWLTEANRLLSDPKAIGDSPLAPLMLTPQ